MPTQAPLTRQITFEAIGTIWTIDIYQSVTATVWATTTQAIHSRIATFDATYSRFRPDSLVTAMAQTAGAYILPPDARPLLDLYHQLYHHTSGALTPLIGQVLSDAGYDANYTLAPRPLAPPPAWDDIMSYDPPQLTLHQSALLDFGAAGKGYLVDLVAGILEDHGLDAYCVDAGGDLRYRAPGSSPLPVGLEHPSDPTQVIGVAQLDPAGASLCGSAGNRRAWAGYHHIINPHTLSSPHHIAAVWVAAATTMLADALTTALFLVEPARLTNYYNFEYALVRSDGSLEYSAGFPAQFFTAP